jgi:excisionase family DNA binding protein
MVDATPAIRFEEPISGKAAAQFLDKALQDIVQRAVVAALAEVRSGDVLALDAESAGKRLGVSGKVIREMIVNRELRGWKLHGDSGEWRISSRELDRFIQDREDAA